MNIRGIYANIRAHIGTYKRYRIRKRVPIEKILMGGENGIPADTYARLIENLTRPSTPILRGPHVQLLREYATMGDAILEPQTFEQTAYYKNAAQCIDATGFYFPHVTQKSQIRQVAADFVHQFSKGTVVSHDPASGHSTKHDPILLRKIWESDCFEIVDGNHRVAAAIMEGKTSVKAVIRGQPTRTPVQQLLLDVLWQKGRRELYQPLHFPEVGQWRVIRRCEDRLQLMKNYLNNNNITTGQYIDVGSSYGWFIAQMQRSGFDAWGIERDPFAIRVGELAYGNRAECVIRGDVAGVLQGLTKRYDVVSCFSVLHHFALGKAAEPPETLISLLGKRTEKVLFFETGQSHENWFKDTLPQWDLDYIKSFIIKNSDFTEVKALGTDTDGAHYPGNYGRTLFACTRRQS